MQIHFVHGSDEYLVEREARRLVDGLLKKFPELQLDIISGILLAKSDFRHFLRRVLEAIQTLPLFGNSKVVWVKSANFFREPPPESEEKQLEDLLILLEKNTDADLHLVICASPIDRRLRISKNFEKISTIHAVDAAPETFLEVLVKEEIDRQELQLHPILRQQFLAKVGTDTRCIASEIEKLAIATKGRPVISEDIQDLTCEGNADHFFEPVEAFYAGDRSYFRQSLARYFANHLDIRPLLTAFQNRNRLLIQAKCLQQLGFWQLGFRGLPSKKLLEEARNELKIQLPEGTGKSNCSIFSQNLWYLGRIVEASITFPKEALILLQQEFSKLFQRIIDDPNSAEILLEDVLLRALMGHDAADKTPTAAGHTPLFAESLQKNGYHNY